MQTLAQFAEARDTFFRQHGYLPNTVVISATNLQSLRALNPLLVEGSKIRRRRSDGIEFVWSEKENSSFNIC